MVWPEETGTSKIYWAMRSIDVTATTCKIRDFTSTCPNTARSCSIFHLFDRRRSMNRQRRAGVSPASCLGRQAGRTALLLLGGQAGRTALLLLGGQAGRTALLLLGRP